MLVITPDKLVLLYDFLLHLNLVVVEWINVQLGNTRPQQGWETRLVLVFVKRPSKGDVNSTPFAPATALKDIYFNICIQRLICILIDSKNNVQISFQIQANQDNSYDSLIAINDNVFLISQFF